MAKSRAQGKKDRTKRIPGHAVQVSGRVTKGKETRACRATRQAAIQAIREMSAEEQCTDSSDKFDPDLETGTESDVESEADEACDEDELEEGHASMSGQWLRPTSNMEELEEELEDEIDEELADLEMNELLSAPNPSAPDGDEPAGYSYDCDPDALFNGNTHPVEYYRANMKSTNRDNYRRRTYAAGTERQVANTETQWSAFCVKVLEDTNWVQRLQELDFETLKSFLKWHLGERIGKNGRRKRTIRSRSSLVTFWCCFRLAFQRAAYFKVDLRIERDLIHNLLAELNVEFNLSHKKRENRSMTLDDLKEQIETTIRTTEKGFKLGEMRVLAVLFLLLLAPQGSRPQSILELRFGDLELSMVRDPMNPNGPARLVIELTLEFTKQYLGPKTVKTFIVPEIMFDPSLLLSPHTFLLAILCRHRAFDPDYLNDQPHRIGELRPVQAGKNKQELPLKDGMQDQYVFRQCEKTSTGYVMSNKPISYGMMSAWVKRIGQLLGFKNNTICYNLRYMAGNNLDGNSSVSTALRNHTMDHAPNSNTYENHYQNNHVEVDHLAILRAQDPQTDLVKQVASHGSSKDPRRPINITSEQLNELLAAEPRYVHLKKALSDLPKGSKDRPELNNRLKSYRAKVRNEAIKMYQKEWARKQAVEDIRHQLEGHDPNSQIQTAREIARSSRPISGSQQRMLDALKAPLVKDLQAQFERRTTAILAIMAYCHVEEPLSLHNRMLSARPVRPPPELANGPLNPMELAVQIRNSAFGRFGNVLRCFVCVAKGLMLSPDDPNLDDAFHRFCKPSSLVRHFEGHIRDIAPNAVGECPLCSPSVLLQNKMHLQNHAEMVHGIRTKAQTKAQKMTDRR